MTIALRNAVTTDEDDYPERGTLPIGAEQHGRGAGYRNDKCRCVECRGYRAAYYATHREEAAAHGAAYKATHREQVAAYGAAYRVTHRKMRVEHQATYYATHRDNILTQRSAYKATPQGRALTRATRHARRAWAGQGSATAADVMAVFEAAEGHCCYCGMYAGDDFLDLEHVVPRSLGGRHDAENLAAACRRCNRGPGGKHGREPWEWIAATGALIPDSPALLRTKSEGWTYGPRTGSARFYRGAPPSDDPRWTPHLTWAEAEASTHVEDEDVYTAA